MYILWIKPPKLKHQGMNKQDQLALWLAVAARVCMQGVTGCAGWTLLSVSTLATASLRSAGVGATSRSTSRRGSPRSSSWCRAWKRRGAPGLHPG